ncbi:MAG: hypothetical protein AAB483_03200 [Patescibacteria group bacterium]
MEEPVKSGGGIGAVGIVAIVIVVALVAVFVVKQLGEPTASPTPGVDINIQ